MKNLDKSAITDHRLKRFIHADEMRQLSQMLVFLALHTDKVCLRTSGNDELRHIFHQFDISQDIVDWLMTQKNYSIEILAKNILNHNQILLSDLIDHQK